METIGDLLSLRRPERSAFGVEAAPVSRNRYDLRMLRQPFGKTLRSPIRQ
jgi:hypothetical protein